MMKWILILGLAAAAILGVTTLTQSVTNLGQLASDAGFAGTDLVLAVAVALAESNGNARAYNPETAAGAPVGKGSYGLWQIYLHAHPEFEGQDLYDPPTNAAAAFDVYTKAGNSFSPWSTFKNGAYQAKLDAAQNQIGV